MISNRQLFLQNLAQTSDFPLMLEIEKAEGIYMYGQDGKQYIDLISGIGVSNVGHRHPKVIKGIAEQLDKHLHLMVYGEVVQSPQVQLAKALTDTLSENLNSVYFVNSGSEATEGALKLAKRYTGRSEIIYFDKAYHGSTHGALSVAGDEELKHNYRPLLPNTKRIEFNSIADLGYITAKTAAVIIEPIQGEGGVRLPDDNYLRELRKTCDATNTLLIFDEVQVGFGRTGKFWAHGHFNVVPDILLCAKGMGGGMPIGAFISSQEIMNVFKDNPVLGNITTFGGHPVSCAASLATLKTIQEEDLLKDVEHKTELFKKYLQHPSIKEIRNKGLLMAVQFESYEVLKPIIDKALKNGVLTDWFLFCDSAMRIAPPLTITDQQIEEACTLLLKSI